MKTLSRLLLIALLGISVVTTTGSTNDGPEIPQWREITSATDTSDFKFNCEYYAIFEFSYDSGVIPRAIFLNFIAVGATGYPGVTSSVSADASRGTVLRVDNTQKNTVKSDANTYPARVFERCYRRLPGSFSE